MNENRRTASADFRGPHAMRHLFAIALLAWSACAGALPLETIKLPPGFAIELWTRVDNARQMALGGTDQNGGVLYVASRGAGSVHAQPWPKWDAAALKTANVEIVVQINGKLRSRISVLPETGDEQIEKAALADAAIAAALAGKRVVKTIVVKKRLVNIVLAAD
jgi:hypothetical protein